MPSIFETFIGSISKNINIVIDIDKTKHSEDRQSRDGDFYFDDDIIKSLVGQALPKITNLLIIDKINLEDEILIKSDNLNIIGRLSNNNNHLDLVVITVMKKYNFVPKPGTYTIKI